MCRCRAITTKTERPTSRCIARTPASGSSCSRRPTSRRQSRTSGASAATCRCPAITTATARPISRCIAPPNGTWYIAQSTTNYATSVSFQWGLNGDVPAPLSTLAYALAVRSTLATLVRASDFDADRKSDLTVYRPSTGAWFASRSSTNFTSFASYQWGSTNDIPVPHDYDGDGRTDIAFYRPSTGHWSILQSSTNFTTSVMRQWGAVGDLPVVGRLRRRRKSGSGGVSAVDRRSGTSCSRARTSRRRWSFSGD